MKLNCGSKFFLTVFTIYWHYFHLLWNAKIITCNMSRLWGGWNEGDVFLRHGITGLQLGACRTMPFLGVFAYRPSLCYCQKINTRNINYMAVLDFLKMVWSEKKCLVSDSLLVKKLGQEWSISRVTVLQDVREIDMLREVINFRLASFLLGFQATYSLGVQ